MAAPKIPIPSTEEKLERREEEMRIGGDKVRVEFELPGGEKVSHDFVGGLEVFNLKHWLREEHNFDDKTIVLSRRGPDGGEPTPILDLFSLIDLPGVSPGTTLYVTVQGTKFEEPESREPHDESAAAVLDEEDEDD